MSERLVIKDLWDSTRFAMLGDNWSARLPSSFTAIPSGALLVDAEIQREGKRSIQIQMFATRVNGEFAFSGEWRLR
jgi:hypothetical protein